MHSIKQRFITRPSVRPLTALGNSFITQPQSDANLEFRSVQGHVEVYKGNQFQFSADTMAEAYREVQDEML